MVRSMHDKSRLVAEVTTVAGQKIPIDHSTDTYETDLDRLREIYGTANVREIKQMRSA